MSQHPPPSTTPASDSIDAMQCDDVDVFGQNVDDVDPANTSVHESNVVDDDAAGALPLPSTSIPSTTRSITELELISKLRLAMSATLHMLEATRDNLTVLGQRMDRLQHNSRACREHLQQQQQGRGRERERQQQPK